MYLRAFHSAIDFVAKHASVQFFLPDLFAQWYHGQLIPVDVGPQDSLIKARETLWLCPAPDPAQLPRFYQPIFGHKTGRRREGDVQQWLESFDWSPHLRPLILSIDLVNNPKTCNALDPAQRRFWCTQAKKGALDGLLVGPPCES